VQITDLLEQETFAARTELAEGDRAALSAAGVGA
jgi:hypothetical protein